MRKPDLDGRPKGYTQIYDNDVVDGDIDFPLPDWAGTVKKDALPMIDHTEFTPQEIIGLALKPTILSLGMLATIYTLKIPAFLVVFVPVFYLYYCKTAYDDYNEIARIVNYPVIEIEPFRAGIGKYRFREKPLEKRGADDSIDVIEGVY